MGLFLIIQNLELVQTLRYNGPVTIDFTDTLRQLGVYVTPQRIAVMKAVDLHPHATADVINDAARSEIGTISRQSVYDALGLLVEKGCIRRIQPIGSPALFESRVGDNHHHLICRQCARVVDVDCAVGSRPCLEASNDNGFEIDEAEVAYWGRCPECQTIESPLVNT
jgi:Fur family ferric uptake transcriptional regulator